MITLESLTDTALLAHYNSRKNAHRAYERSDGATRRNERHEREACEAEIETLTAEWRRRQGRKS